MLLRWPFCHWVHWISFGGGVGLIPFAPGTWGSLWGVLLAVVVGHHFWLLYIATIVVILLSLFAIPITSKALNVHDHSSIVIDEVAGQLMTYCLAFECLSYMGPFFYVCGFVLFRCFDIFKIGWAKYCDQQQSAVSVTLDDLCAGFYAAGVTMILSYAMNFWSL